MWILYSMTKWMHDKKQTSGRRSWLNYDLKSFKNHNQSFCALDSDSCEYVLIFRPPYIIYKYTNYYILLYGLEVNSFSTLEILPTHILIFMNEPINANIHFNCSLAISA